MILKCFCHCKSCSLGTIKSARNGHLDVQDILVPTYRMLDVTYSYVWVPCAVCAYLATFFGVPSSTATKHRKQAMLDNILRVPQLSPPFGLHQYGRQYLQVASYHCGSLSFSYSNPPRIHPRYHTSSSSGINPSIKLLASLKINLVFSGALGKSAVDLVFECIVPLDRRIASDCDHVITRTSRISTSNKER